jgi:hypothetical protein
MRSARFWLTALVLIANLITVWPALAAPAAQGPDVVITSPKEGDKLNGVVQIMGTATNPTFDRYELSWASQNAPDNWQMIASVQNRIVNGSLGTWDTTNLPSGVYRLRLIVVRQGDKTAFFVVNNLSINQGTPTPAVSPTPPVAPTIPPSPVPGAGGPTPTVAIAQPPTSTPQPAATKSAAGTTDTSGGLRTPSIQINFSSFGGAFCNGALYTVLIFVVWGIVWSAREIFRWVLRQARQSSVRRH